MMYGTCDTIELTLTKGLRCIGVHRGMSTYCRPDSMMVQIPSSSPPASMSSKPPPNLDKLESVSGLWNDVRDIHAISPMKSVLN
jgi:hypothetical protein